MNTLSPERFFRRGLGEMRAGNHSDAAASFRKALELDRKRAQNAREVRYLSYYGLSLARAGLSTKTALEACTMALSKRRSDPVLYLNLGRVYRMTGKPVAAIRVYERGLSNLPDHKLLARELARIDRRSKPTLPFLSRDHPLNCYLGKRRRTRKRRPTVRPR